MHDHVTEPARWTRWRSGDHGSGCATPAVVRRAHGLPAPSAPASATSNGVAQDTRVASALARAKTTSRADLQGKRLDQAEGVLARPGVQAGLIGQLADVGRPGQRGPPRGRTAVAPPRSVPERGGGPDQRMRRVQQYAGDLGRAGQVGAQGVRQVLGGRAVGARASPAGSGSAGSVSAGSVAQTASSSQAPSGEATWCRSPTVACSRAAYAESGPCRSVVMPPLCPPTRLTTTARTARRSPRRRGRR